MTTTTSHQTQSINFSGNDLGFDSDTSFPWVITFVSVSEYDCESPIFITSDNTF